MARLTSNRQKSTACIFIENAFWPIGAVFFMVVGGIGLAGAWLGL
jgi:hypothetical protein